MTDKQIIETLKKIKENCIKKDCHKCVFVRYDGSCLLAKIGQELCVVPECWNIGIIDELLHEDHE